METVCACQCIFIYSSISITGPIICLQSGSLQTNYPCENTRLHFFEIESFGLNHLLGRYSFAFINSVQHGYLYVLKKNNTHQQSNGTLALNKYVFAIVHLSREISLGIQLKNCFVSNCNEIFAGQFLF